MSAQTSKSTNGAGAQRGGRAGRKNGARPDAVRGGREARTVQNLQAVLEKNREEAQQAMQRLYAPAPVQPSLFEDIPLKTLFNPKAKTSAGLTAQADAYARFRALGYSRSASWRMSHLDSAAQPPTVWSKASRLEKQDRVQARILFWRERIEKECLMSTTELFARLSEMARSGGKDAKGALELIGRIHGVFQAERGLPGGADNPLTVQCVNFNPDGGEK